MHTDSEYDHTPLGVEALTVYGVTATDGEPMQWSPQTNRLAPGECLGVAPAIEYDEWNPRHEREALRQLCRVLGLDC